MQAMQTMARRMWPGRRTSAPPGRDLTISGRAAPPADAARLLAHFRGGATWAERYFSEASAEACIQASQTLSTSGVGGSNTLIW